MSNLAELADECCNGSQKDEGLVTKLVQDAEDGVGDVTSDFEISQKSEKKRNEKSKRSKSELVEEGVGVLVEVDDVEMLDGNSSENQFKGLEGLLSPENKHKKGMRSKSSSVAKGHKASVGTDDSEVPDDCALGDQVEGK